MEPALLFPPLFTALVPQRIALIVRLEQILDNCTALPEIEPGIRVLNRRHAAIGIHAHEGVLFQIRKVHQLRLVRDAELLENDGDFPWVGPTGVGVELDRLEIFVGGEDVARRFGDVGDGGRHVDGLLSWPMCLKRDLIAVGIVVSSRSSGEFWPDAER